MTLFALAQKACLRNVVSIHSIGEMPFDIAQPILRNVQQPKQLRQLELDSPHLIGKTHGLWLNFIRRDIPSQKDFHQQPEDPDQWYDLYETLLAEHQENEKTAEQWLRNKLSGIQAEREVNVATGIDTANMPSMGKVRTYESEQRRNERLRRQKYNALPTQNLAQGSRIKIKSGADVMRRVKIEARNVRAVGATSRVVGTINREEIERRRAAALETANHSLKTKGNSGLNRETIKLPLVRDRSRDGNKTPKTKIAVPRILPQVARPANHDTANRTSTQKLSPPPRTLKPEPSHTPHINDLFDEKQPTPLSKESIPSEPMPDGAKSSPSISSTAPSPLSHQSPKSTPPSASTVTPTKVLKRKAPADPFLRVKKRA